MQSGVLFAPMIVGLFWKGANRYGAFASVIVGAITALLDMTGLVVMPERMLFPMAIGTLALVVGSLVTKNKVQKGLAK
jgi:Na+/proline symporter